MDLESKILYKGWYLVIEWYLLKVSFMTLDIYWGRKVSIPITHVECVCHSVLWKFQDVSKVSPKV